MTNACIAAPSLPEAKTTFAVINVIEGLVLEEVAEEVLPAKPVKV